MIFSKYLIINIFNLNAQIPQPLSPNPVTAVKSPSSLRQQPPPPLQIGATLARTSSSGSGSSPHPPSLGSAGSQRQSSQGSLFEQFASQAKELVKETTRQSSQDGLLAHVDKVHYRWSHATGNWFVYFMWLECVYDIWAIQKKYISLFYWTKRACNWMLHPVEITQY